MEAEDQTKKFIVRGQLRQQDGSPLSGIIVRAYNKGLRIEQLLGEAVTDDNGDYEIKHAVESADLIVRAGPEGEELAASDIKFRAGPEETLDLRVPRIMRRGPSEFERLSKDLEPHLKEIKVKGVARPTLVHRLSDLKKDEIEILAGKMGGERLKIEQMAAAARMQMKAREMGTDLSVEVFYALSEQGKPLDLGALYYRKSKDLRESLEKAVKENVLPSLPAENLDKAVEDLKRLPVKHVLNTAPKEGYATLGELFSLSLSDPAKQATLLSLFSEQERPDEAFWAKLKDHPNFQEPGLIDRIKLTSQLAVLTQNHLPLMRELQEKRRIKTLRDMADLDPDDWKTLLKKESDGKSIGVPAGITGESQEQRIDNYAKSLFENLRAAFPTAFVGKALARQPKIHSKSLKDALDSHPDLNLAKPLPDDFDWDSLKPEARTSLQALQREIRMFPEFDYKPALEKAATSSADFENPIRKSVSRFFDNVPEFDLSRTHIDSYLAEHGKEAFKDIDEKDIPLVTSHLKSLQRVFNITPKYEQIEVLMGSGINSAYAASTTPKPVFLSYFSPLLGGEDQAKKILAQAEQINAKNTLVLTTLYQETYDATPAVIGNVSGEIKKIPNLENLFGRMDLCDCEHCRSFYSPAAYFVDLLHFLDSNVDQIGEQKTPVPIDSLLKRRPDLVHIKLSCENTNTLIPYVDLVNEILEFYVAYGMLSHAAAKNSEGFTSEELLADPQYMQDEAYEKLMEQVYPFSLPFNQPLEQARLYLEHLGTSLSQVKQIFAREELDSTLRAIDAEILGISHQEYEVLTGEKFDGTASRKTLQEYYGFDDNNFNCSDLKHLKEDGEADPSPEVIALQRMLNLAGADPALDVDGKFGPLTHKAVIDFQRKNSLTVDGVVGPNTWKSLMQAHPDCWKVWLAQVPVFLSHSGLSYIELMELVKTYFINPNREKLNFWNKTYAGYKHVKSFYKSKFIKLDPKLSNMLIEAGVSVEDYGKFFKDSFGDVNLPSPDISSVTVVLASPDLSCDLSFTRIQNLNDTELTDHTLNKMHRFIRLWRKLGWSMHELDAALVSLNNNYGVVRPQVLQDLAEIKQMQSELDLSPLVLLSFWRDIDANGNDSLYHKLFLSKPDYIDEAFKPGSDGQVLTDKGKLIIEHESAILAALQISSADLSILLSGLNLEPNDLIVIGDYGVETRLAVLTFQKNLGLEMNGITGPDIWKALAKDHLEELSKNMPVLKLGSKGTSVRVLHNMLPKIGRVTTLFPSSTFSRDTFYRLMAFQQNNNIDEIGTVGPKTWKALIAKDLGVFASSMPVLRFGEKDSTVEILQRMLVALEIKPAPYLTINNVSTLYRHAVLAKALRLRIADLLGVKRLCGIDPFKSTKDAGQFIDIVSKIKESGFAVEQLKYIYSHISNPPSSFAPQRTNLLLLAKNLRENLTKIHEENSAIEDPTGEITSSKLGVVFEGQVVSDIIKMLDNSMIYSHKLANMPNLSIDTTGISIISYDTISKHLQFKGEMAQGERELLLSLSKDRDYQDAIDKIFQKKIRMDDGIFRAPLENKPELALDTLGESKIFLNKTTDSSEPSIRIKGAMTSREKEILDSLCEDLDYRNAIVGLYQQPRDFLSNTLDKKHSGFLDIEDAKTKLFNDKPSGILDIPSANNPLSGTLSSLQSKAPLDMPEKFKYVLKYLQPYLRDKLSRSSVKQIITDTLSLDASIAELLLEDLNKDGKAMKNCLGLINSGLSADYFEDIDFKNLAELRIDTAIAFNGKGKTSENIIPKNASSARWRGMLLASNNGKYSFFINTSCGAKLWIDDKLILDAPASSTETEKVGEESLKAGQLYDLRVELVKNGSMDVAELSWSGPGTPKAIIPSTNLYPLSSFENFAESYIWLHKISLLVNGFDLSSNDTAYISRNPSDFEEFRFEDLPAKSSLEKDSNTANLFKSWLKLNDFVSLRDSLPKGEIGLADIVSCISLKEMEKKLILATGWDEKALDNILENTDFKSTGRRFRKQDWIPTIKRLQACMKKIKFLGVSSENLFNWANEPIDSAQARMIKDAVRAKYDKETWLSVAKPISDLLREKQRDALIAYVLTIPNIRQANVADSNQLFEYFLIDPEMSACMKTSRIKQAISSVQLFVQRCLMNLEPDVLPKMIDSAQWEKWMEHYRIWEANRKVFLYPENWIEPELRDDKTPLFKEFESELLQNDINKETAELALRHYLERLDDIKKLEICAMCYDEELLTFHIFGRTYNSPNIYYYIKLIKNNLNNFDSTSWICSPWQKVDLDIKGPGKGIHLIPVVFNKRLYLFWPEFKDKSSSGKFSVDINLNYSECDNGKWLPKKVSDADSLKPGDIWWDNEPFEFFLENLSCSQQIEDNKLFINFYELITTEYNCPQGELENLEEISRFSVQCCGAKINVEKAARLSTNSTETKLYDYKALLPHHAIAYRYSVMEFSKAHNNIYPLNISILASQNIALNFGIFNLAKEAYRLIYADDFRTRLHLADSVKEFFYDDGQRSYFMIPFMGTILTPNMAIFDLWLKLILFFHPNVDKFMQSLSQNGIKGLMTLENQKLGENDCGEDSNFEKKYDPNTNYISVTDYPSENVDFEGGVYAQYNRELFFHASLLIADRLSKNQRFEEAQKWFHYIFNPLDDCEDNPDSPMQRYWKYLPFYKNLDPENQNILKILLALNNHDPELEKQVRDWRDKPFEPHLIARSRMTAYQKNVVMKYIENLISWGDQLFRQDTIESINEATQLYILAANILGSRPENIPTNNKIKSKTYHDLKPILNSLSNPMVSIETTFPVCIMPISNLNYYNSMSSLTWMIDSCSISNLIDLKLEDIHKECQEYIDSKVPNVGYTFYFCIPYNYKLIDCWDKVEDRLFKIRHCMNIEGIVRELPLFEPPIDPALLVQAAARGMDLSSLLSDFSSPMAYYRFPLIIQKAFELCSEVRSYGSGLLSALEKKDSEELANLRAKHETSILEQVRSLKEKQLNEAEESYNALLRSRDIYVSKYLHYQLLLGVEDLPAPPLNSNLPDYPIPQRGTIVESQGLKIIQQELSEISKLQEARDLEDDAASWEFWANLSHYAPKYTRDIPSIGKIEFGGDHIGHGLAAMATKRKNEAAKKSYEGNENIRTAGYIRREQEWILQTNLAAKEIMNIDKQIVVAEIKKEIAEIDLKNHEKQIENAKEIEDFLFNKYTNEELYGWMIGQISGIYFQCYKMAFDMAKQAEKAYRFELGMQTSNFIQFGYWDNLRKGLLAGERLHLALKNMEKSYYEENRRGYEITKNVSLVLHDPLELIRLKETGVCQFTLPEAFFDADYPGHYMRRIKSVSLTIPCVAGPYTSINCKLTLLSNKTRINSNAQRPYPEGDEDNRFVTNFAAMQSIATSHAQNDSGMFELNFRDERYLPFEGAGAISRWRIEMDKDCNAFDFNTISDVIIKLNYTSREGGELLRQKAKDNLMQLQKELSARLFSMKHEFPNEWYEFLTTQTLEFKLAQERFPYQFRGKTITVNKMEMFLLIKDDANQKELEDKIVKINLNPAPTGSVDLRPDRNLGGVFSAQVSEIDKDISNTWKLAITDNAGLDKKVIEDLIILCHYSAQERR